MLTIIFAFTKHCKMSKSFFKNYFIPQQTEIISLYSKNFEAGRLVDPLPRKE
jgi:hypothetical protein